MSDKLIDFKRIIREANYENTYKMAWAKSLVEVASSISNYEKEIFVFTMSLNIFKFT